MEKRLSLFLVDAEITAEFVMEMARRALAPVIAADPSAPVSFHVSGRTKDRKTDVSGKDLKAMERALRDAETIDYAKCDLGDWDAGTKGAIQFHGNSHTLELELVDVDEARIVARRLAFAQDERLRFQMPDIERTRESKKGYAGLPLTAVRTHRVFLDFAKTFQLAELPLRFWFVDGSDLETGVAPDDLRDLLNQHWLKTQELEIRLDHRGLSAGMHLHLPSARVELNWYGYPEHPSVKKIIGIAKDGLNISFEAWKLARSYRTGTLTYKCRTFDFHDLKNGVLEVIKAFKNAGAVIDASDLVDPFIDRAFITFQAHEPGHGPIEKLTSFETMEKFLSALDPKVRKIDFAGLSLIGVRNRTLNIDFNFKDKQLVVWSTEDLGHVVELIDPLAERLSAKLVGQLTGESEPGKRTGIAPTIGRLWEWGTLAIRTFYGAFGIGSASLLAAVGLNFISSVSFTHPLPAGETFQLAKPGEIALEWDQDWGLSTPIRWSQTVWRKDADLPARVRIFKDGTPIFEKTDHVGTLLHSFETPGLYRIDVEINEKSSFVFVEVVEQE